MKNEETKLQIRQLTKYEKRKLEEKKKLNKENLIKEQIVQGKKYQGKGFEVSEKLEFLDFEVGQVYTKDVDLINISWSFNTFKVLPIPKVFQDNFEIEYAPPGRISAGISVPLKIVFFPQSRVNIDTYIPLLCETGKIQIPIKCRYKTTKAQLTQDKIDFKTTVIGEEKTIEIYVENKGGLQTKFEIQDIKGQKISKSNITMSVISSQSDASQETQKQEITFDKQYDIDFDFFQKNMKIEYEKILKGYSRNKIKLTYKPDKLSQFKTILVFKFENFMDQQDLKLEISGKSKDPYISSKQDMYDMKICLLEQIYRQKIVFINKSRTTSNIKIIQPEESKEFFQFNPQLSFIQPQSQANIWLKVNLKEKIRVYLEKYIDSDILILPIKANCSEQKKQIKFEIKLQLSSQQIQYQKECYFGKIFENTSSVKKLTFTNKSKLPCKFLYQNLPKNIDIVNMPNPFEINPEESLQLLLKYKANKIGEDKGKLIIKYILGQQMTGEISQKYYASIRKSPLKISALKLEFPICQPLEIHNHFVLIQNISKKNYLVEFQPPPFQFSGIQVDVKVSNIESSCTKKFPISFNASFVQKTLTEQQIEILAQNENKDIILKQQEIEQNQKENEEYEIILEENKKKKNTQNQDELKIKIQNNQEQIVKLQEQIAQEINVFKQDFDFDKYLERLGGQIKDIVLNGQEVQLKKWLIPIQFKETNQPDTQVKQVFLEIQTLVRKPVLELTQSKLDFGILPLGFKRVLNFEIVNKTDVEQDLKMDLLKYNSGFNVLNILQKLGPYQKQQYCVRFQPEEDKVYNENLRIFDQFATTLQLTGQAIYPEIHFKDDKDTLDMGAILCGDFINCSFQLINQLQYDMLYTIKVIEYGSSCQGIQNVFEINPIQEKIPKNSEIGVNVKFQSQLQGTDYYLKLLVEVKEMKEKKYFYVKTCAFKNYGYVIPYIQNIKNYIENQIENKNEILKLYNDQKLDIQFELEQKETEQIKQIIIGNISSQINNPLEFETEIENIEYKNCFWINLQKGKLNSGEKQILDIKYTPKNFSKCDYNYIEQPIRFEKIQIYIKFKGDIDNDGNKIDLRTFLLNVKFSIYDIVNQSLLFNVTCI